MQLYFSSPSPYVRKCMVVAHELGLAERIEKLPSVAHPVNRDRSVVARNPLGKVPTLIADDGTVLYDSRVVCEYLDALDGRGRMFPIDGAERWRALAEQALGDGLLDAAVLLRYEEIVRPEERRFQPWIDGQFDKIRTCLAKIETEAASFGERVDIGTVTLACALGYLDLRFADLGWRRDRPAAATWFERFGARPSMQATLPQG